MSCSFLPQSHFLQLEYGRHQLDHWQPAHFPEQSPSLPRIFLDDSSSPSLMPSQFRVHLYLVAIFKCIFFIFWGTFMSFDPFLGVHFACFEIWLFSTLDMKTSLFILRKHSSSVYFFILLVHHIFGRGSCKFLQSKTSWCVSFLLSILVLLRRGSLPGRCLQASS